MLIFVHNGLHFKDIRQQIEASTTEADLALPATALAEARATLTDKTDLLPSYDRQRHEQVRLSRRVLAF